MRGEMQDARREATTVQIWGRAREERTLNMECILLAWLTFHPLMSWFIAEAL